MYETGGFEILAVVFLLIAIWVYFKYATWRGSRELHGRALWKSMFRRRRRLSAAIYDRSRLRSRRRDEAT